MDNTNKQNLTPELKEIYDRVMNTSKQAPAGQNAADKSSTTQLGTVPTGTQPQVNAAASLGEMPSITSGMPPGMPPSPTTGTIPAVADQNATTQVGGNKPGASGEFLSSISPRPLQDIGVKSFSFTGKKVTATTADEVNAQPAAAAATAPAPQAIKGISKPILIALVFVFIVIWSVFWAIFLGIIKL